MQKKNPLIEDAGLEKRALEIIVNAGMPVSIDYVAYNLKTTWPTARALLFKLASQGKVKAVKTTKSWIFTIPRRKNLKQKTLEA
jgi:predicted ArsR family transcriptional regulator